MTQVSAGENPLAHILQEQDIVILDGGLGTELQRRGAVLDPQLWSAGCVIDAPEVLKAVHTSYLDEGADVIIAASYQASISGFMKKGHSEEEAVALLRRSVEVATEARDEFWAREGPRLESESGTRRRCRPLVAASIGCYGAFLADGSEYRGQYGLTEEELKAWHAGRLRVLAHCGADLLALETLPCEVEVRALLSLLQEDPVLRAVPCWVSMACRDARHLNSGDSLEICGRLVASSPARVLSMGVNCTNPVYVEEALGVLASAAATVVPSQPRREALLLHAYPNTGEAYEDKDWVTGSGTGDEAFATMALAWKGNGGARLIGGCCRTTPDTIRELRRVLIIK